MNAIAGHAMWVVPLLLLLAGSVALGEVSSGRVTPDKPAPPVTIRFWGHACFTITADGKTLLIDPYNEKVGYKQSAVRADVVLISHNHFDHADTSWVRGEPVVIRGLDEGGKVQSVNRAVGPFHVRAVEAQHWDDPANKARGSVAVFVIEVHGLRIVHLADLGQVPDDAQVQAIGRPDVLLIPVGGFFTIDGEQAWQVVGKLQPRAYVVPMHYRTAALNPELKSRLAEPAAFLRKFGEDLVRLEGNELTVDPANLPAQPRVVLIGYEPSAATQPAGTRPAGPRG